MSGAPVVVIGAGPAGLTAALTLAHAGVPVMVCEAGDRVGGIARSESYQGYRFDVGGHRFLTKVPEIEALWRDWLGDELLTVHRQSRILYDRRFFDYPLRLPNVLGNLGPLESARIVGSYARACLSPVRPEQSFADWVTNRFGDRLYRTFFKTYTEKVWGVPCDVIRADWAAQRIRGLSLTRAVSHAVFGRTDTTSLAGSFLLPEARPGPDVGAGRRSRRRGRRRGRAQRVGRAAAPSRRGDPCGHGAPRPRDRRRAGSCGHHARCRFPRSSPRSCRRFLRRPSTRPRGSPIATS